MLVRELAAEDVGRIREIDRSERACGVFVVEDGELRLVERQVDVPTWNEAELAETLGRLTRSLAGGGVLLGVSEGGILVAAAVLGGELLPGEERRLELVFLHVSRGRRRRGLARLLFAEVCRRARARGAARLYVSSSDVAGAVAFYLSVGCVVARRVDPVIAARWPEDVPLELEL